MTNPAYVLPDAQKGIQTVLKAIQSGGTDGTVLELVHLRASQINGCSACIYAGVANARKGGESEDRLATVVAWRESPFFTDAERAALALTEAVTRVADRSDDAVSDTLWDEVADHFDEKQLSSIILMIGITNLFNRINATVREPAGKTW
ncbi:MAG TPA: carboxymuconolactone decarboxylase family protein [Amycolatopsis sp.]|nr:carboxymuconolactone decarboxylase family protein [Amycolatopsis sp.]